MLGVFRFIGRINWLVVLIIFFGAICIFANRAEQAQINVTSSSFRGSSQIQRLLKLQPVSNVFESAQLQANNPKIPDNYSYAPSYISTLTKVMYFAANLKKPYWPYRPDIDCAVQKCVALTFDDGPSANTPAIMDILKAKNSVATFFVTGYNVGPNAPVLKRMILEKDEIGNHGFGHKNFKRISSPEVDSEINSVQDSVFNITGYRPHLVRPPYGEFRLGEPILNNTPIIFWNIDPDDWKNRNPSTIDSNVLSNIKPGSIIVMHDLYPTTVTALPPIIDNLQKQGYSLVTVTELLGWKDPTTPLPNGQLLRSR
jgi:peptidoglycan/xylan/chitin deacetylase (PgdA/CDA1 family)